MKKNQNDNNVNAIPEEELENVTGGLSSTGERSGFCRRCGRQLLTPSEIQRGLCFSCSQGGGNDPEPRP